MMEVKHTNKQIKNNNLEVKHKEKTGKEIHKSNPRNKDYKSGERMIDSATKGSAELNHKFRLTCMEDIRSKMKKCLNKDQKD